MTRAIGSRADRDAGFCQRIPSAALCTLAMVAVGELPQSVSASPRLVPEADLTVVPGQAAEQNRVEAIAPPESLVAQEFTAEAGVPVEQGGSARYYQDYQAVAPASLTETAPAQSVTSAEPSAVKSLPSSEMPRSPDSLTSPVWIVPAAPTSPEPQAQPFAPASQPNEATSDLAVTVADLRVVGADSDLQQLILSKVQTKLGGAISRNQLEQDVATILNTGFFANARFATRNLPTGVGVVFQIEPIVVRSIQLANARLLTPEIVNEAFRPQIGTPVSLALLNQGVEQINRWYAQNGYSLGRVAIVRANRNGTITLEVAEGVVNEVQFRFANREGQFVDAQGQPIRGRTRESFLRQETRLKSGQIFREAVIRQDEQRLKRLGLFEQVTHRLEGDAQRVTVVYELIERPPRVLNFGAGFNKDTGIFGSVLYRDENVGGVGQQFSNSLQIGQRVFQFDTRFTNPYRESTPDRLGNTVNGFKRRFASPVFDDDIRLVNGDRVREDRIGGGAALIGALGDRWQGTLGFNYARVSLRDRDGDIFSQDADGNPLSFSGKGIDDLFTLSFSATQDLRDNPAQPTRGSVLTLSTEQSLPIGLGRILGNRLQANYAQFIPVNFLNSLETKKQPEVLAFNVQGGTVIGDLPPYNAFNLGGARTVRGYGSGDVGSGRSYVLFSTEYRFPLINLLGGVVFADFASDLGTGDNVLGEPAVKRGKPGSGFGFGAGVRFRSPIGLIRADLGINDQGETRLQLGFGEKF